MNQCTICSNNHDRKSAYCSSRCKNYAWYHQKNGKQIKSVYRKNNIDTIKERERGYVVSGAKREKDARWYHKNGTEFYKNKRKSIDYRLKLRMRSRLYKAIKNHQKIGSAIDDLGCSIEYFRQYMESLWEPGMNWENWSINGWHIDHIQPLDSFDLSKRNELLKACHYTNLQPLWAKDNIAKSNGGSR